MAKLYYGDATIRLRNADCEVADLYTLRGIAGIAAIYTTKRGKQKNVYLF
jgi:hypothetical protein